MPPANKQFSRPAGGKAGKKHLSGAGYWKGGAAFRKLSGGFKGNLLRGGGQIEESRAASVCKATCRRPPVW